jgi:hypothetical protein
MTYKTIEELYPNATRCDCGEVATVRDLCRDCWNKRASALSAEAIAEEIAVARIKEDIMRGGYSIRPDDTRPPRYDPVTLINRLPRWLRWFLFGVIVTLLVDGLWRVR